MCTNLEEIEAKVGACDKGCGLLINQTKHEPVGAYGEVGGNEGGLDRFRCVGGSRGQGLLSGSGS